MKKVAGKTFFVFCLLSLGISGTNAEDNTSRGYPEKPASKVKQSSLGPRVPKDFQPPPEMLRRLAVAIEAYKECYYGTKGALGDDSGDKENEEERKNRVLGLNFEFRFSGELTSARGQIGYEVCLADVLGLKTYETIIDIVAAVAAGELVELDASDRITVPSLVVRERQFVRPWVRDYLKELEEDIARHFTEKAKAEGMEFVTGSMRISSLVRDHLSQKRQKNSIASCVTIICSVHTRGSAVDFSIHPHHVTKSEEEWLRDRLVRDRLSGRILVIQEFHPPHFHVFVLPSEYWYAEKEY